MKNWRWSPILLLLCLVLTTHDALAAKRLGAGSSIGKQRNVSSFQAAPTRSPPVPTGAAKPATAPAGASTAPLPGAGAAAALPPAAVPARARSWLGPLAGFAGGALLGGMLFGNGGFGGFGGGGFGGLLMVLAVGGVLVWLVRRFLTQAAPPQTMLRTEPAGWMPAPPPQANPIAPLASAPDGGALRLPPGFDLPAFLRESRLSFVRLQAANDRADIADLREFTTPQMFAEISLQIQERGEHGQEVEVVALDAQLLDLAVDQEEAVASVQFHGTAREDRGPPQTFSEIWHVRKRLADPRSSWLLAGIQQIA